MSERTSYPGQVPESIRQEAMPPTEISIESGKTAAKIAPEKGGLVTSFTVDGIELIHFDTEPFKDPDNKKPKIGIPILTPFAGKYQEDTSLQHGGAREVPWSWRDQSETSTTIGLDSKHLPEEMREELKRMYGEDFEYETEIVVSVEDGVLKYEIKIKNNSDTPKKFAPGLHPYFTLPNSEREDILTNLEDFDISEMSEINPLKFDMPENGAMVTLGNRTVKISGSSEFKNVVVWGQDGADAICFEPFVAKPSEKDEYLTLDTEEEVRLEISFEVK